VQIAIGRYNVSTLETVCVLTVLLTATANIYPQANFNNFDSEVSKILLKKDLRQAIKEAEASANDLPSLLRRLSLYRRAVHNEKTASTVRQIIAVPNAEKNHYAITEYIRYILKDPLFKDSQTLKLYLQFDFNGDIYGRFIELCSQNRQACDFNGFDQWLAQKAEETQNRRPELTPIARIVIGHG
jgi:hypothetical protein